MIPSKLTRTEPLARALWPTRGRESSGGTGTMQRRCTLDAKLFGVAFESMRPSGGPAAVASLPRVDRNDIAGQERYK